jgi:hypothetical protein
MRTKYIFVLGRPACGKSAFYRMLEARIQESELAKSVERVDDFPLLRDWFLADDALDAEGKERIYSDRSPSGAYVPRDHVLDDLLKQVNATLLEIDRPDHLIVVEFARPSYVDAIQNFDLNILDHCLVVYLQVSFETCWQRNQARRVGDIFDGGDDHALPRETMEALYRYDDRDELIAYLQARGMLALIVDNEADGLEHLKAQMDRVLEAIA